MSILKSLSISRNPPLISTTAVIAFSLGYLTKRYFNHKNSKSFNQSIQPCSAHIGMKLSDVETPCLIVDMDAMESNLRTLPITLEAYPNVQIRPHVKAHKSSMIAKLQLELSKAKGVCCQKVTEVEAMVNGGIHDILLSNEIVCEKKYQRLAALAKNASISLVFDNLQMIELASKIALDYNIQFTALVDVNVGQNRCGVDTKEEALELSNAILQSKGLKFQGIQAYHGKAQHIRNYQDKKKVISNVADKAKSVVDFLQFHGISCNTVTGGGTGTYLLEAASGVFTEVQPGSYIFMDVDYSKNLNEYNEQKNSWSQSLFVLTSIMSVNSKGSWAVVDAGLKAISLDSGVPLIDEEKDIIFENGGDEHGILLYPKDISLPILNTKLKLIPGHCDPTVNLYDNIVGIRNNIVEKIWRIEGRGPGL